MIRMTGCAVKALVACLAAMSLASCATQQKDLLHQLKGLPIERATLLQDKLPKLWTITESAQVNRSRLCSGVAVSPRTILTAAHCIVDADPASLRLSHEGIEVKIEETEVHPMYDSNTRFPYFDIALLRTVTPILEDIFPVILSRSTTPGDLFVALSPTRITKGRLPIAHGALGLTMASPRSVLRAALEAESNHFDLFLARMIFNKIELGDDELGKHLAELMDGLIIAIHAVGARSICRGDSGAPAMKELNGEYGVVAIASALSSMDPRLESQCPRIRASIFTSLHQSDTVQFLRDFDQNIRFR